MKTILAGLIFLLSSQITKSQFNEQWEQRYNGTGNYVDVAGSISIDKAKNVYVTGNSYGSGSLFDYIAIKYNPSGNQEWVVRYNGTGNENDFAVASISDKTYLLVTGLSYGSGTSYDYATIKYNNTGEILWTARYNGTSSSNDAASAITEDNSGNIYVTGQSYGGTESSFDFATVKYNSDGIQQWVVRYNGTGSGNDAAYAVTTDLFQNVYVTGQSTGIGSNLDYVTIKYNSSGTEQWVARYNGPANGIDVCNSISINNSGEIFVTGYSKGSSTSYDIATIKYDNSGNQLWISRFNGTASSSDIPSVMKLDINGNVLITGVTNNDVNGVLSNYITIKYNTSGITQWAIPYNGTGNNNDSATSMALDDSGNVFVTGKSIGSGSSFDFVTIEYNPAGIAKFTKRYNSSGISKDVANAITIDNFASTYITGASSMSGSFDDILTIKYSKITNITILNSNLPDRFELFQNFPNPFNPLTVINYSLPLKGISNLRIFDMLGNEIETLVNEYQNPGTYSVKWNAEKYPSGVYYYSITTDNFSETRKMLLVK